MPDTIRNQNESLDIQRPFPGLRSFEEINQSQFGGRDVEINELFNLVDTNCLTIVFGKSGIGKTSLIKAGLISELQKNFYFPIYVRVDFNSSKSPLAQVRELVTQKIATYDRNNILWNDETLWEFFHNVKINDGLVVPVLILDQFEELFTLGDDETKEVYEFLIELADLAENRVPFSIQEKLDNKTNIISSNYGSRPYRLIISLREDYLAQLEGLKKMMPSIRNSRYRVLQLTTKQALEAILKPGKNLVTEEVAIEIIKKLPEVTNQDFYDIASDTDNLKRLLVEPFLLSMICYQLNERRLEHNEEIISYELVSNFQIEDVINTYYEGVITTFSPQIEAGLEDTLLTESGYRKLQSVEELYTRYSIKESDLQLLVDKRIIRKEIRDGVEYIELIHDVLAPTIRQKREERIRIKKEQENAFAIEAAVKSVKEKSALRLKKIRTIAGIAAIIIITVFSVVFYYARLTAVEAKRLNTLNYAEKILLQGKSVSAYDNDFLASAFISRVAYLLYARNNGDDFNPFYNALYAVLEKLDENFTFSTRENSDIKALNMAKNTAFIGCNDGMLYALNWSNPLDTILQYKFSKKITDIKFSPDNKRMAVTGTFDTVAVFDLQNLKAKPYMLKTLPSGNRRLLTFVDTSSVIVLAGNKIQGWQINFTQNADVNTSYNKLKWNERLVYNFNDGVQGKSVINIKWGDFICIKEPNESCMVINSIASAGENLIIGLATGILIIKPDSAIDITSKKLIEIVSLNYNAKTNFIYAGSVSGAINKVSVLNYSTEYNLSQTGRINSIICSIDGNHIASASGDNSIALFTNNTSWQESTPIILNFSNTGQNTPATANSLCFTENGNYLLAGYNNGKVIKWPVSADILCELICNKPQFNSISNINTWDKYIDKRITEKYLGIEINNAFLKEFSCENN